jgi:broad specificity phosphatase PhoE
MVTDVLCVRHGESYSNTNDEFSCRKIDHGLTQRGIDESTCAAQWLSTCGVSAIYASPLKRAKETAIIIGQTLGSNFQIEEAFREVNVGLLEGQPSLQNWRLHNDIIDSWKQGRWDVTFPKGESFTKLVRRVSQVLTKLASQNPGKRIVVITHGAILLAIRYGLCGENIVLDTPTGSIIRVSVKLNQKKTEYSLASSPIINHLDELNKAYGIYL